MSYRQEPEKKLVCVAGSSLELLWVYFRPTKIKIESWLVHQILLRAHVDLGLARKFSKHVKLETEI